MHQYKQDVTRALAMAISLIAGNANAIGVDLASNNLTTTIGSPFEVQVSFHGLQSGLAPSLAAYDFDVGFDLNQFSFVDARFGDTLMGNQLDLLGLGSVQLVSPQSNQVNLVEISLDSQSDLVAAQLDSFSAATLRFRALKSGSSQFSLTLNSASDADGTPLSVIAGVDKLNVTAVPEPESWLYFLAGILLIGGKWRQLFRKAQE